MSYTFKPAVRVDTPLIIGLAGPTKSGKTYSALRLATGLSNGKPIVMLNAEGPRGHQYAEKFTYLACELSAPYRPTNYTDALEQAAKLNPGCIVIDSVSHCHDGPGGCLEWHEEIITQRAGANASYKERQKYTFSAWIEPKAAENELRYVMLSLKCPLILCMRAKEKIKIISGKEPVDLGWQPIVGEQIAFETIFTLMLTPGCKGVPSREYSQMREPFDTLIPMNKPIDEQLGAHLKDWAQGSAAGGNGPAAVASSGGVAEGPPASSYVPPSDDAPSKPLDEVEQEYIDKFKLSESVREASQTLNDVLDDSRVTGEMRTRLQKRGKDRIAELGRK